ncbi:hypothetical protein GUITHDRAFT_76385 [Guillardia theta CCMP2712]|uniref:Uric acid-xanthine permease n=1 Tax=Guillardia theta (strain CCMP2712) TaxID=905079 RepID=L1IT79_GUITC|nr:hypothetical protein GUITHDRAFT_76385 [Guillardia theta CCMP2712]EKX39438.1 hypothetical protein GUITHDRAFT_76385 [Guillardia theta CCMP2712]|eukprot:XP_005826418.1 hypothetical protein GUITHDRAFT_76385 [Guillardia theta CCMP2712]
MNWWWLCMPRLPWSEPSKPPPFYGVNTKIPLSVAMVMGFQHALAMIGGIIAVPLLLTGPYNARLTSAETEYLISAGLLSSGILSLISVTRFKVFNTGYFLGTGLISVLGTSFTFVPIAQAAMKFMMDSDSGIGQEAYGAFLGTAVFCAFLEIALSFLPKDQLRRCFPPIITGTCVMLIGFGLTGEGFKYWGGGTDVQMSFQFCQDNGQVKLPFGSPQYVTLGFAVFLSLIMIEVFGSPFLRNCEVAIALLFGFFISAVATYNNDGTKEWFVVNDKISSAPGITFLWVKTFPLTVYPPAILPCLICYIITTVETIGDITASAEASKLATVGDDFDSRIQGGVLADGFCAMMACLFTTPPNTTFAQNNGVIALTRCANRRAGYCCCFFLILFGIIAKVAAVIATIPDCVLGGMTTFLFVNIVVSGVNILGPAIAVRRNRFIVCASLAVGIGVALAPQWATNALVAPGKTATAQLASDSLVIVLSTPYCIGTITALLLHLLIPNDKEDETNVVRNDDMVKEKASELSFAHFIPTDSSVYQGSDHTMASQQGMNAPVVGEQQVYPVRHPHNFTVLVVFLTLTPVI